jgi:hypothetical protein
MAHHAAPHDPLQHELPYPEQLAVPPTTVGQDVVALADLVDWHGSHEDDLYARLFAQKYEADMEAPLHNLRTGLAAMSDHEKAQLAPYVQMLLADHLPQEAAQDPTLVDRLSKARNDKLLLFFGRHVGVIAELQEDSVGIVDVYKSDYIDKTYKGVAAGWISSDAHSVRQTVPNMPVEVGDYWSTHRHGYGGGYYHGEDRVEIPQGLGHTRQQRYREFIGHLDHAFDHETNHREFGAKLPRSLSWFNEAMSEHTRLAMRFGHPEVLDPSRRSRREGGVYTGFRTLVYYAAEHAPGGPVEQFSATKGFTSNSLKSRDWQAMEAQFNQKWGVKDFLGPVSDCVDAHRQIIQKAHPDWGWDRVEDEAGMRTVQDLGEDPRRVFGERYKKPRPRVGAAALQGSTR